MAARLGDLSAAIGIAPSPDWADVFVTDITEDSRSVRPGSLFVAVPGATRDGADFIDEAIGRGAAAIASQSQREAAVPHLRVEDARAAMAGLASAFHGSPTQDLFTVGVTGTNGKTTVCQWTAHLLGVDRTVVIGTLENESRGLPAVTTPSSPIVQRLAAEARDSGAKSLIVEASSIGLAQRRLDAVDFDVAVFTNLSHDHLDAHGTKTAYLEAKRTLFSGLKGAAHAIVNADDPTGEVILAGCHAEAVRYGVDPRADLRAIDPEIAPRETCCSLAWRGATARLRLPHPGVHNLSNALAAASVALVRGAGLRDVTERLGRAPAIDGRLQFFTRSDGVIGVVDFAHTPDSLRRAMEVVRPPTGRLFVVFGCPGASDRAKRPLMGEIAGSMADRTILTADNPKHEDPESILDEIEVGLRRSEGRWERVIGRADAADRAVRLAHPGDVVLLAGKGHERYQIIGGEFVPYSDRATLERLGFREDLRSEG